MRTPQGKLFFINSPRLSGCYLPHSALFPPKSVCPSSPPETVSISAADPPHTEPIPGFSHTEHQYKSLDIQIYPLNTETSSYFHHTQGSYKFMQFGFGRIPVSAAPRNTLWYEHIVSGNPSSSVFRRNVCSHFVPAIKQDIASTEYGRQPCRHHQLSRHKYADHRRILRFRQRLNDIFHNHPRHILSRRRQPPIRQN